MSNSEKILNFNKLKKIKGDLWECKALTILDTIKKIPYDNVSDEMIQNYLLSGKFIDTMDGIHKGYNDLPEHHAQRIASLINLLQTGVILNPVVVYCNYIDNDCFNIECIDDGWHRLRASYYLDQPIRFILDFNE